MEKYKVGDRVRVIYDRTLNFPIGTIGVVKCYHHSSGDHVGVQFESTAGHDLEGFADTGKSGYYFRESEVELVKEKMSLGSAFPILEIGDKVRVISRDESNNSGTPRPSDIGKEAYVTMTLGLPKRPHYQLFTEPKKGGDYIGIFSEHELELLELDTKMETKNIQIGDTVKSSYHHTEGQIGTVVALSKAHTSEGNICWQVNGLGDGGTIEDGFAVYSEKYLEVIKKSETLAEPAKVINPETNPLNVDALELLVDIFVKNEDTNNKIIELFEKIVAEKQKQPEEKKEDSSPKEQPQESQQQSEGQGQEEAKEDSEPSKKTTSKKSKKPSTEPSKSTKKPESPEESEKGEAIDAMVLKILESQKLGKGGTGKLSELMEKIGKSEVEEGEEPEFGKPSGGEGDKVDVDVADKVWCGVHKKYHTRGKHD